MKQNSSNDVEQSFKDLFRFECLEDEMEHEAYMISFRFLSELEIELDKKGMNRTDFAREMRTSKSYITQLFRGHKLLNLAFIAKAQKVLGKKFSILLNSTPNVQGSDTTGDDSSNAVD
jgi:antitoxin component HigA of HigAB toxin-antitoxin module